MDQLIVKGFGRADGEYDIDVRALASPHSGLPGALDTRELHRLKLATGVMPADLREAVVGADAATLVALTAIILARYERTVNDERLWDARYFLATEDLDLEPYTAAVVFRIVAMSDEGEDAGPPEVTPVTEPQRSGGESFSPPSVQPENAQSPTGLRVLETSAISPPEMLAG